mmetsp:Transcript_7600/g.18697  ORF Transcript_7600/g.18697 Transcript_7600/m.18697 type:complete len:200 (+) Transcript_7600:154-753(+)
MNLDSGSLLCLIMAILSNMICLSRAFGFRSARRGMAAMGTAHTESRCVSAFHHVSTRTIAPTRYSSILYMSTTSAATPSVGIKSIDFIEEAVLDAMNELFDPAEVARGAALAKLNKPKKKKKKKKKKSRKEPKSNKPKSFKRGSISNSYDNSSEFQFVTPEESAPAVKNPAIRRTLSQKRQSRNRRSLLQDSFKNFGID